MKEAGAIIGRADEVLYWHLPSGRTSTALPDSASLWDVLWRHREDVVGFAHTHPGAGVLGPSYTDVTTFAAVEVALGRRLVWWIAHGQALVRCVYRGSERLAYETRSDLSAPPWLTPLRRRSGCRRPLTPVAGPRLRPQP